MSSTPELTHMGRRVQIDHDEQSIRAHRTLRSSGGSTVLTIPGEVLESVGFEPGDEIEIEAEMFGDEIRLRKAGGD